MYFYHRHCGNVFEITKGLNEIFPFVQCGKQKTTQQSGLRGLMMN